MCLTPCPQSYSPRMPPCPGTVIGGSGRGKRVYRLRYPLEAVNYPGIWNGDGAMPGLCMCYPCGMEFCDGVVDNAKTGAGVEDKVASKGCQNIHTASG